MHPRAAAQGGVSSVRRPFSRTTPPVLRKGIPIHFCRPPPRPRLRRRIPIRFCRPPPRPRLRQGYLYASAGLPHPARASCRQAPHTLLPGHPHPTRACGAPPPPPEGGGVRAWRYQGSSRIWVGAGVQPCSGLLRDLPMCWTVEISPRGEGPTGRGNSFPLPCPSRSNHLASRRHPLPAPPAGRLPTRFCRPPPPRPRGSERYP